MAGEVARPARTDRLVAHALQPRDQTAIAVDQRKIGDDGARVVAADVDPRPRDRGAGFFQPYLAETDRQVGGGPAVRGVTREEQDQTVETRIKAGRIETILRDSRDSLRRDKIHEDDIFADPRGGQDLLVGGTEFEARTPRGRVEIGAGDTLCARPRDRGNGGGGCRLKDNFGLGMTDPGGIAQPRPAHDLDRARDRRRPA
jgi:hypothetical protein